MDFFVTHYTFTFCLIACFAGTVINSIAPFFTEDCLAVCGRKLNLGIFGTSVFVHQSWGHAVISFLLGIPGLLFCEHYYGEELTFSIILCAGILYGVIGLIFDKSCFGFSGVAVLLGMMASLYGFHWYGFILAVIIFSFGLSLDAGSSENNIHIFAIIVGIVLAVSAGEAKGTINLNYTKPEASAQVEASDTFELPVKGRFYWSSDYGYRKDPFTGADSFHKGTDLACAEGTRIIASNNGKVESVGYDNTYGNFVVINHGNGYKTKYAHMKNVMARKGDNVEKGEEIGTAGSTGYSTGPHLHFMVYKNGKIINPKTVLN